MKFQHHLLSIVITLFLFFNSACKKSNIPDLTISINPTSLNIAKNISIGHRLTIVVSNGSPESVIVKWSSSNAAVAVVTDAGFVTGLRAGEAEIIATPINGQGFATCKVTVYDDLEYKFRLILKDKGVSSYSVTRPEKFLSSKAIERRKKRGIAIDETDLPISPSYLKDIENLGGVIVAQSKWLNTVSIHCRDEALIEKYKKLPFVENVKLVWEGKKDPAKVMKNLNGNLITTRLTSKPKLESLDYGAATKNISIHNGQMLHDLGYKGAGIDIAVIDAGFKNIETNPSLDNIHVKGSKSFIYGNSDPFNSGNHGVWVTSCMATNKPGYYIGTAPEANYWLLRTEDETSENPIEEDYWVAAMEFADSVGVDIVNTSLYYSDGYLFDNKYENLDGKTAFATRGANMAVLKGIFIVGCAGNDNTWVGTPADSPNVLTVGSVNSSLTIDQFTSFGMTADGRMKPDIVSLGGGASLIDIDGTISNRSGTSYATPIISGLVACLWQAYPQLTNKQLLEVVRKSGDRYSNPVLPYGYGIPDMGYAFELAKV
ncbi:MAG: hypothetical protein JWQ25_489, partial [Daejeonella sp.]|nr:hypothetical protein [Daejeonella sp.]